MEELKKTERSFEDGSTVRRIKYHESDEIFEVEYNGGSVYHYFKVPVEVAKEALKRAAGVGMFVAHQIKGVYEYKKVK